MTFQVENKTALVTGANRGIGRAIVDSLIAAGAKKIYLAVRNPDTTQAIESQYGNRVETIKVDMNDPIAIKALAKQAIDVELLINNAGVLQAADPLSEHAEVAFEHELNVNVFGLIRIAQAFSDTLERNHGALVQLNSVASIKNFAPFTTYSASKAASYAITQGLRESWANKGIQVLSVHPGPIATDMADSAGMTEMAEPASVVADGIIKALATGEFHLFPDSMARDFGHAYESYAKAFIEPLPDQD